MGSDAVLVAIGILGVSTVLQRAPQAQNLALWMGVGLMLWHGLQSMRHLFSRSAVEGPSHRVSDDRSALLLVSFFNPVAWMDTVLVIGTTGAVLPSPSQLSYGMGAVTASTVWFLLLTSGARRAARWMESAGARKVLDTLAAVAMIGMAGYVAAGLV